MKEKGIVTRIISGKLVEVAIQRSEACAKCRACHDLGQGMMGIEAVNEVEAKREDVVEIEIPSEEVVKGSMVVFLLPIFFLIVGYLVGSYLMRLIGFRGLVEVVGVISALLFLAASFFAINWYDKNIVKKEALRAHIVKIITSR
jgi:sigma-E factor negative regulatory protein RseC